MKYFVQLKDGVVFSYHESSTEVDIEGDNTIQVESDGEQYLNKKYENNTFIDIPKIRYAILDEDNDNTVIGIEETYFSSDVKNNVIIEDPNVQVLWKWNGSEFYDAPLRLRLENEENQRQLDAVAEANRIADEERIAEEIRIAEETRIAKETLLEENSRLADLYRELVENEG
jgi:hypothetical protein